MFAREFIDKYYGDKIEKRNVIQTYIIITQKNIGLMILKYSMSS